MRFAKTPFLIFTLAFLGFRSFAQDYKTNPGYRFSREEMNELLLHNSRSLKNKAICAVVLGPILTGVGAYIMNKDLLDISFGGGYLSARESNSAVIGKIICATGIITTFGSVPLFIAAGKAKRAAKLVLSDASTGYLNKKIPVPSIGLRVTLP